MEIAACLAWYYEPEGFLERAIESAGKAGVTHLVAVDGAYALFPDGEPQSPETNLVAIYAAAERAGMECWLYIPDACWPTEASKRSFLFQKAHELGVDWLYVMDADFDLVCSRLLPEILAEVEEDVGFVRLLTPPGPGGSVAFGPAVRDEMKLLYRGNLDIRVVGNHYTYQAADGRFLFGNRAEVEEVPAADLTEEVVVHHWSYHRQKWRIASQYDYYRARDKAGIERSQCRCGEAATSMVTSRLTEHPDGWEASWLPVCERCLPDAERKTKSEARRLGIDPREAWIVRAA
jgi:hypothetical protein